MTLYTIQERRGSAADWAFANTVLEAGQWAIELGTGKAKLGDGITAWNDLPYYIDDDQVADLIAAAIARTFVLLEVGEGAESVPEDTQVGVPVFRKA